MKLRNIVVAGPEGPAYNSPETRRRVLQGPPPPGNKIARRTHNPKEVDDSQPQTLGGVTGAPKERQIHSPHIRRCDGSSEGATDS